MHHRTLQTFVADHARLLAKGPVALIFAEDPVEVDSTLQHHLETGFRQVLLLADDAIPVAPELEARIHRISHDVHADDAVTEAVNRISAAAPAGSWIYYCYNAEYLFFPFCETRTVRDLLAFHTEERRDAMLTYVIDLYAGDLGQHPNGVALQGRFYPW